MMCFIIVSPKWGKVEQKGGKSPKWCLPKVKCFKKPRQGEKKYINKEATDVFW